ncbi:MAG: hypothetical protein HC897_17045, partial [Thermoanaerobaculia bacterium]|nr:hypothetical protein [Thermoanaerobaculia bacterium]
LRIEALAPVPERRADGTRLLRWFGDVGKTKNGHSVVLRLVYRDVVVFLGGDLNIPAEDHLLAHYTGLPVPPRTAVEEEELVAAARRVFGADVAKSCHHGSADFREVFLRAIDAAVTVISSGDDEAHSHPRADTLGAIGRYSRGARPLIFNTELARSAKELVKNPQILRERLKELQKAIGEATTDTKRASAQKDFEQEVDRLERSIAVYGMISLRTDGRKILLAQKLEKPRGNDKKWDLYSLEPGPDGRLRYQSKYAE